MIRAGVHVVGAVAVGVALTAATTLADRDQAGAALAQPAPEEAVLKIAESSAGKNRTSGGHDEGQSEQVVEEVGDQRSERHELTVREVGEPGGTEDEAQSDCGQCDRQAEDESVDQ